MTKVIIKAWRWLPALAMMIIIFLLSSMRDKGVEMPPALQPKIIDTLFSKSAHVFLFGLLAFSFEFGFNNVNDKANLNGKA
ncbi:VanZ family protein [Chloroflexota bacterium]